MKVNRNIKAIIKRAYNTMASELYSEFRNDAETRKMPVGKLRLMIGQVVISHILSKTNEDLTTATRVTKNKVTRQVNKRISTMNLKEVALKQEKALSAKEISWE